MPDYTTPKTWTTSELLTAADLNTYVRDNVAYLATTPQVAVRLTSAQTIPNATATTLSWDEAPWESVPDMWDIGTPTKIIIPRAGVYVVTAHVLWDASADPTDDRDITLKVNTSETRINQSLRAAVNHASGLSIETNLAVDDELEIQVEQATGGDLDVLATRTRLTVRWSSDAA